MQSLFCEKPCSWKLYPTGCDLTRRFTRPKSGKFLMLATSNVIGLQLEPSMRIFTYFYMTGVILHPTPSCDTNKWHPTSDILLECEDMTERCCVLLVNRPGPTHVPELITDMREVAAYPCGWTRCDNILRSHLKEGRPVLDPYFT